jgi:hypothetical protein
MDQEMARLAPGAPSLLGNVEVKRTEFLAISLLVAKSRLI